MLSGNVGSSRTRGRNRKDLIKDHRVGPVIAGDLGLARGGERRDYRVSSQCCCRAAILKMRSARRWSTMRRCGRQNQNGQQQALPRRPILSYQLATARKTTAAQRVARIFMGTPTYGQSDCTRPAGAGVNGAQSLKGRAKVESSPRQIAGGQFRPGGRSWKSPHDPLHP